MSDGQVWIMDCGDLPSIRLIHCTEPNGRYATSPGRELSWRRPAPWDGAQRLLRISLDDDAHVDAIEPFGTPGGGIIAPPVQIPEHQMAIARDSVNGGHAGVRTDGDTPEVAWQLDARASMQLLVYPDSGELVINDFTAEGSDDLIVVDIATGTVLDRVATGSRIANGMFLTPGDQRDVYYCTTTTVARVARS